jgi:hypothetical protein
MFSRIMHALHPIFAWLNAIICVGDLATGNFTGAAIAGVLAGILFWQMTW